MNSRTLPCVIYNALHKTFIAFVLFQIISSAPLNTSVSYDTFLESLTQNNCAFPEGIILPFKQTNVTLNYFGSELLKICKDPAATSRSKEAITLCNDIYDNLRNITCHTDKNIILPEIKIEFSDAVCQDVVDLQLHHTLDDKSFLKHLATDKLICDLMCDDDFLPACQVLFWSYQLKKRIDDIHPVQAAENTNDHEVDKQDKERTDLKKETVGDQALMNDLGNPNVEDADQTALNQNIRDDEIPQDQKVKNYDLPQEPVIENESKSQLNGSQEEIQNLNVPNVLLQKENIAVEPENPDEQLANDQQTTKSQQTTKGQQTTKDQKTTNGQQTTNSQQTVNDQQLPNNKGNEAKMKDTTPKILEPAKISNKIIHKNNPAVAKSEIFPKVIIKPDPKKDVTTKLVETQKEVTVKETDNTTTTNDKTTIKTKLVNKEHDNELAKLQETVSTANPKALVVKENEVKVSLKPEVIPAKVNDGLDNQILPTVKEDPSLVTTVADLEKMERGNEIPVPAEKEPDIYNDVDGEGQYSKIDYEDDDGFFESSKNKKIDEAGKIERPAIAENESPKYDVFPPPGNAFRREPDGIQVIPAFPEQEDSHFFFYFLSMVFILMAGYLVFHNKQKIIALIVEGRHERRRRSHGVGYRKLETK